MGELAWAVVFRVHRPDRGNPHRRRLLVSPRRLAGARPSFSNPSRRLYRPAGGFSRNDRGRAPQPIVSGTGRIPRIRKLGDNKGTLTMATNSQAPPPKRRMIVAP